MAAQWTGPCAVAVYDSGYLFKPTHYTRTLKMDSGQEWESAFPQCGHIDCLLLLIYLGVRLSEDSCA